MNVSLRHSQASFSMDMSWSKDNVIHEDRFFVNSMNCWRDLIPGSFLYRALNNQPNGGVWIAFLWKESVYTGPGVWFKGVWRN